MRIVVAGASGFVGTALVRSLRARGDDVTTLVRRPPRRAQEVQWDPAAGRIPATVLDGADAVVNLAGAGVADRRWNTAYKQLLVSSRVDSTRTLAQALADHRPQASLLQASAIGYYGNARGDEILTEESDPGRDFLASLCVRWEAAADPARQAGVRVACLRTGLVMGPAGGSFGKLLPLFRLGAAGPLSDGSMWWSWITLPDEIGAIEFLLDNAVAGPVNLTAPDPQPNRVVTQAIARALHRPAVLPVPRLALRAALGEFAEDAMASQRVVPKALLDAGFQFQHADLDQAARWFASQV